ncbi:NAD(P)/FAD-dependent oxidoreductase [Allosphingosinicella humi]
MRRTPALIIGGGPAGAAAGIMLAKGGERPRLVERTTGPHDVVCGGFLGWDALAALHELGIDPATLGARPIHHLRLVTARRSVEVRLPRPAAGLSRAALDAALLEAAADAGARVSRGKAVRQIDASARSVRLDDGEEIAADALFLASGKHDVRGAPRLPARARDAMALGLRARLPFCEAHQRALADVVELHLFDDGYAGFLLQEDGSTNICLSAANHRLNRTGGIEPLMATLVKEQPRFGERLREARTGQWTAVAGVPYGWRARRGEHGLFRLGDQAAVIASLTGDGIAIALQSGMRAAAAFLAEGPEGARAFQEEFARDAALPLKIAGALKWAAERPVARGVATGLIGGMPSLARLAAGLTRIDRRAAPAE